ncbi:CARNS1, partial [Symbiodinium sp. KB8]
MEEVKYSRSEVMMLMTLLVLVIPYIWMAARKVYSEWTRISMIGMVRINSSSKNYIFHRTTCRYVQGEARNGYFIHLEYDTAVAQGYRPCYVCFPEAKKAQKHADEDDEWELTSESTDNTENEGCGKKCTWCKVRKCTRKKPAHVYCSCTECIQKYTEDLWRGQYDKDKEAKAEDAVEQQWSTPEVEEQPPTYEDSYDMIADP